LEVGETGVFIEWCESLCNDRSLMKCSLGFDSQCGESVGPCVTVPAFQHRSLATRKPARATGGGAGPTPNERVHSNPANLSHQHQSCTRGSLALSSDRATRRFWYKLSHRRAVEMSRHLKVSLLVSHWLSK